MVEAPPVVLTVKQPSFTSSYSVCKSWMSQTSTLKSIQITRTCLNRSSLARSAVFSASSFSLCSCFLRFQSANSSAVRGVDLESLCRCKGKAAWSSQIPRKLDTNAAAQFRLHGWRGVKEACELIKGPSIANTRIRSTWLDWLAAS
jgi:hypothetical protein